MEKEIEIKEFKGFWGRLLCKHNYINYGKENFYTSIENQKANLPTHTYYKLVCKKMWKD